MPDIYSGFAQARVLRDLLPIALTSTLIEGANRHPEYPVPVVMFALKDMNILTGVVCPSGILPSQRKLYCELSEVGNLHEFSKI